MVDITGIEKEEARFQNGLAATVVAHTEYADKPPLKIIRPISS
jgi:hypothetical protein